MESLKESTFTLCKSKSCCHNTKVVITGFDMWRICTVLDIEATDFTEYTEAPPDVPATFMLSPHSNQFQVVLAHKAVDENITKCIFLWNLNNGYHHCGLNENKPLCCNSYPYIKSNNKVSVGIHQCTCTNWSLQHTNIPEIEKEINKWVDYTQEYSKITQQWNDYIIKDEVKVKYKDFCDFVLSYYKTKNEQFYS